jgi:hypothetical protein
LFNEVQYSELLPFVLISGQGRLHAICPSAVAQNRFGGVNACTACAESVRAQSTMEDEVTFMVLGLLGVGK